MIPEQQRLLETFTLLVANAFERLTLTASEEQARMASEREQIRNALLAALSHDLRTPLTVLFGQAEILTLDLASEGSPHARQASEIRQHVLNTTRLVNNLLDMARIQSGGFNLKKRVVNAGRSSRQRAANAGTGFIVAHQSFSARTADLNPR